MRVAYLSLQAVAEGQDSWAAVTEIIAGWERAGWRVDRFFPSYPAQRAPGAVRRLVEMWRLQRRLKRVLAECDVLYVRGHNLAFPAMLYARACGVPVVQECNGTYEDLFIAWPAARLARPVFEYLQRAQYRNAALIVCGTEQQRTWLRAETGHDRILVSPNGANAELFSPTAVKRPGLPARFVLFFGQFASWQGIEVLIAAKQHPTWPQGVDLVFVGDGERRGVVEEAVVTPLSGIHYLGRLPYGDLAGVIAHCVASTSVQYAPDRGGAGFSALKLYESMSCGVPVIGSDYPGVADVIRHYECGIVVPPGDPAAVAGAVARIVDTPSEAQEFGLRGRAAIELECSWEARTEQRRCAIELVVEPGVAVGRAS